MFYKLLLHHTPFGDYIWWIVGLLVLLLLAGGISLWIANRKFEAVSEETGSDANDPSS